MPDDGRVHVDDALRNQITHQYSMIGIAGMHICKDSHLRARVV